MEVMVIAKREGLFVRTILQTKAHNIEAVEGVCMTQDYDFVISCEEDRLKLKAMVAEASRILNMFKELGASGLSEIPDCEEKRMLIKSLHELGVEVHGAANR